MKSKSLLYVAAVLSLCNSALAQEIYPYEGVAEEPAYLLNVHGCNLYDLSSVSKFVPIERKSSSIKLILSPSRYLKMKSSINQEITHTEESSAELKKAKKKVTEFEDIGNIPAMKHWEQKVASLQLQIARSVNARLLPKFTQEIIATENPVTYYARSIKDRYKMNTIQELVDITGDNCVETLN